MKNQFTTNIKKNTKRHIKAINTLKECQSLLRITKQKQNFLVSNHADIEISAVAIANKWMHENRQI